MILQEGGSHQRVAIHDEDFNQARLPVLILPFDFVAVAPSLKAARKTDEPGALRRIGQTPRDVGRQRQVAVKARVENKVYLLCALVGRNFKGMRGSPRGSAPLSFRRPVLVFSRQDSRR